MQSKTIYMEQKEVEKFVAYCNEKLDFTTATPVGYRSAPLCALDAIFSLGVRYGAVVNAIKRFCVRFNLNWETTEIKTSDLLFQIEKVMKDENIEIDRFAELYLTRQKTSTSKTGILKAEAYLQALRIMKDRNIETCENARMNVGNEDFESSFTAIPGQRYGTSLHYFYMLCGDDNFIKVDRHIHNFSCTALEKKDLTKREITELFSNAVTILRKTYPDLTPKKLDHIIWSYMSKRK